jgi:hypothetical protein
MFSVEYKIVRVDVKKRVAIQKLIRISKFLGLVLSEKVVGQETVHEEDQFFKSRFTKYLKAQ